MTRLRVAVTGSRGFHGTALVRRLEELDVDIIKIDREQDADICDYAHVDKCGDFDVLVHLAAKTFVPASYEDPRNFYLTNLVGTLNALELCRTKKAKMVFASSYVYGIPLIVPIDESQPVCGFNPYSGSKISGEQLCERYHHDYGLPVVILRIFNVYGPGQCSKFLIPSIIDQALCGKIVLKDPSPKRDFVYIDDVVEAYVKAIRYEGSGLVTANIASGESYSVQEVVDEVLKNVKKTVPVIFTGEKRLCDVPDTKACISKARALLQWHPSVDFSSGIKRCVDTATMSSNQLQNDSLIDTITLDPQTAKTGTEFLKISAPLKKSRFEKFPRATLLVSISVILCLFLVTAEVFLEKATGLGNPVLYDINPLYGYRPKSNQMIAPYYNMGFLYGARVTTNNLGLRGSSNWDSNPSRKILFLGDSVTYGGQYIDDEQLFSTIAGQAFAGWQVGNGGVNAWGVENIVGLVMDSGFTPSEVVVTCLIEADFYRGLNRAGSVPLWIERPKLALYNLMMHHIWRANESRYGSSTDFSVQDEQQLDRIVTRAARRLRELDDYLRHKQIQHIVFILPTKGEVLDDEQVDSRVSNALLQQQVNAIYLLPKLQDLEKDHSVRYKWFHDDVHLEPSGHSAYGTIMSRELSSALARRNL